MSHACQIESTEDRAKVTYQVTWYLLPTTHIVDAFGIITSELTLSRCLCTVPAGDATADAANRESE